LEGVIRRLKWKAGDTEWGAYYDATNYDDAAMTHKMELVDEYLGSLVPKPTRIQDLGANTGRFSRVAARYGQLVLSQDVDPAAVEFNFQECVAEGRKDILPLLADLTNPSPGVGWAGRERSSFLDRGHADATLALALIHHLAISNNVPLQRLAEFLSGMTRHLIIEFVPKQDSQVQILLATREDVFPNYTREGFEAAFEQYFTFQRTDEIKGSERTLYLMENKAQAQA
jgi:ribosomal protein L11 methylase PrmA